jgi:dicarboxylate transporter 10
MTYSVTRLGAYDMLKSQMSQHGELACLLVTAVEQRLMWLGKRKLTTGEMVLCASGAGALGGLAGNPAGE